MPPEPLNERTDVAERFDPATMRGEMIEAEHMARYRWASEFAAGRRVLDAGCGTAYGTKLIAEAGPVEVIGLDVAAEVVEEAREVMPAGVELVVGDLSDLPFESGRFDLVVCFEVIEHLEDHEDALDELRRILAPAGLLAISSPNRGVYPEGNPHHVHEFSPDELREALEKRFSTVRLERQHTWITSGVLDSERFVLGDDAVLGADIEARKLVTDEIGQELYTVALAADCELPEGKSVLELATQVELRRWDALWHEQAEVLSRQDEQLREQAEVLSAQAEQLSEQKTVLQAQEERIAEQERLLREQAGPMRLQEAVLGDQETLLREQADHIGDLQKLLAGHAQALQDQTRLLRQKDRDLDRQGRELAEVRFQLAENETELSRLAETESLLDEMQKMNMELLKREEDLDELVAISQRYTVVVSSTSWRVTRPLRRFGEMIRKLRG